MPNIDTLSKLTVKLDELKKARDQYMTQANFQLGVFAGQVALLEEQLAAEAKPEEEDVKV
jgi:hypothetical protein